ncbi:MAG TPA: GH3 auxin-responsive promoter family protein [Opitutaceae bacterium]|jgi:hypothetical protein|nr:GH3 auxin-responsive promoter family protein [Opitutaceae bacterium]
MNPKATAANAVWLAASLPASRRFRHALAHPDEVQWRLLRSQLVRNARCAYGRAHGFGEIRNYAEFARRVPIVNYDDCESWIRRIMRGEQSVLTEEPVTHLAPTSGSSGARKLIPFNTSLQRSFSTAIGPWMVDLCQQHPSIILGPAYWSVTPIANKADTENSAVPVGFEDDGQYLGGVRRRLVDAVMAVPSAVRHVTKIDAFRRITLLLLLRQKELRLISIWHPSFLALLLDAMPAMWEELLSDIHSGGCSRLNGIPQSTLMALRLPANPRRAAELQRADPSRLETVWPMLRVVSCWGDAHAGLALADLARRIPHVTIQPKGLLATEAVITIPFSGKYPVALGSHFFEFIDERGAIRQVHELRETGIYEVVVTTGGGLWRYRLGDQVEVTGFLERTPSLRFIGRAGLVSDRFGEKLSEAFVSHALREAWAGMPTMASFAMLAPEETSPIQSHYTLYVEGAFPDDIPARLDVALSQNPHYAYCRDLGQLHPPRIFKIDAQAYDVFVAAEMRRGMRLGEIKPIALSLRTDWSQHFSGAYLPSVEIHM